MSIESGLYTITAAGSGPVQRGIETQEKGPKPVIAALPDVKPEVWKVEKLDNSKYILTIRGDYTVALEERVFAFPKMDGAPPPEEWVIKLDTDIGFATVELADQSLGWTTNPEQPENNLVYLSTPDIERGTNLPFVPNHLFKFAVFTGDY